MPIPHPSTHMPPMPNSTATDQLRSVMSTPRHRPRSILTVLAIVAAWASTASPAVADDCPNATLRAQNNSTNLPDCRAYEMVTPTFKEGFTSVNGITYTDDGAFAYQSPGNFADIRLGGPFNQYVARRTANGWQTTSPTPSGIDYGADISSGAEGLSADLGSSLWLMRRSDESTDLQYYYLRGPDGVFTRIGPTINPDTQPPGSPGPAHPSRGAEIFPAMSADLSHVLFRVEGYLGFPGDTTGDGLSLYEYVGAGNNRPRLVGVDNSGSLISTAGTCSSGISVDGRVVFFEPNCGSGRLWARIDGTTSIEMSASRCMRESTDPGGVCSGPDDAQFVGKASDGSRAFFTTSKQLVDGDVDLTRDIYACDIPSGTPEPVGVANPCDALTQVSGAATDANVENVLRVSSDGTRVYFLARGVLAANEGVAGEVAVAGDRNLYVWRRDAQSEAQTTFVAKLDSIGATAATDDGRYLAFATSDALIDSGLGADADSVDDVYRYDAEARSIERLSTSTAGGGGNDSSTGVLFRGNFGRTDFGQTRAMTADGRGVIFETSESLSALDLDTASDVYMWNDGRVSQITSGGAKESAITASGRDIFFSASAQLTGADGDTNFDIYTARVGGGFSYTRSTPCTGGGCQGQRGVPPRFAAPRSDALLADGDKIGRLSLGSVGAAQLRALAATGRMKLKITASTPGVVRAAATAKIAGRRVRVASARRRMVAPGTVTLTLTLTSKARRQLAARGRLAVRLVVSGSNAGMRRSATLRLTRTNSERGRR